ncbi:MAG: hypothetical protein JJ959_11675 [Nisaea sp.]|uniref:hypothetical protein n=1 Tax=Nisaea sp. TaxID=2024842 RepID=UPI001B1DA26C|nr:hypothetical protein [Nisaea sp.]MBO6561192.1 hypothetical protein [Nisaea sp.]
MSIRYWLYAVALGGCLIAAAAALAIYTCPLCKQGNCEISNSSSAYDGPNKTGEKPAQNDGSIARGGALQDAINRVASTLETIRDQPEPSEQRNRAQQDLQAQQSMAQWACIMTWVAILQSILTVGGMVAIFATLKFTADQARAAERAIESAENTSKIELRAYLAIVPAGFGFDGNAQQAIIYVRHENSGQTLGKKVRFAGIVKYLQHPIPEDYPFPNIEAGKSITVIHPRQTFEVPVVYDGALTGDEIIRNKKQRWRFFVFAKLLYEDIFGVPHETTACWSVDISSFHVRKPGMKHDVTYEYAEIHNDAD